MYGGSTTLEYLRIHSGTSIQGTSLLGLKQAAESLNMEADIFEVDDLDVFRKEATFPCIQHVTSEGNFEHYVVCFGYSVSPDSQSVSYSIIDPAMGVTEWTEEQLLNRWRSRTVLCLAPTDKFQKREISSRQQWNWFVQLIREDIPLLLIAMGLGILLSLFGLATAVFNQKLIDEILPQKDIVRLWAGMSFLLVILILRAGLNYLRTFLLLRYAKSFNVRLLYSFYRKLFHLPKIFFDTRKIGEIIARLNDTRRIQGLISYLTAQVAIDILVFLLSLTSIMFYSWQIGLVAATLIPVFSLIVLKYRRKIEKSQREVMSGYAASESHFIDIIGLIEPIKLASKENFFSQIGKSIYGTFQERLYKLGKLTGVYYFWNELTHAVYTAVIILLMSLMVLNTQLLLGEFMAILTLTISILGAIARISMTNFQMQEAFVAFNRMYEFANIEPERNGTIDEGSRLDEIKSIQIRHLSFRFPGSGVLLQDVNLNLVKGRLTVLLGEVGSGKSVILQLLQKFRNYESGQILVNNAYGLPDIDVTPWRKKIGVVPQTIKLFAGSIIENIVLDRIDNEEQNRFLAFCTKYSFDIFLKKFPQTYLTFVGEDGCNLSGGQIQMIALMRALYNEPDVLLLDEPTSAMDSKTELFVLSLLKELKSEKIILMVTHGRNYTEFADIIIHLQDGKTFDSNTPAVKMQNG
jgi:ATP-binding cassette subfamily B protein